MTTRQQQRQLGINNASKGFVLGAQVPVLPGGYGSKYVGQLQGFGTNVPANQRNFKTSETFIVYGPIVTGLNQSEANQGGARQFVNDQNADVSVLNLNGQQYLTQFGNGVTGNAGEIVAPGSQRALDLNVGGSSAGLVRLRNPYLASTGKSNTGFVAPGGSGFWKIIDSFNADPENSWQRGAGLPDILNLIGQAGWYYFPNEYRSAGLTVQQIGAPDATLFYVIDRNGRILEAGDIAALFGKSSALRRNIIASYAQNYENPDAQRKGRFSSYATPLRLANYTTDLNGNVLGNDVNRNAQQRQLIQNLIDSGTPISGTGVWQYAPGYKTFAQRRGIRARTPVDSKGFPLTGAALLRAQNDLNYKNEAFCSYGGSAGPGISQSGGQTGALGVASSRSFRRTKSGQQGASCRVSPDWVSDPYGTLAQPGSVHNKLNYNVPQIYADVQQAVADKLYGDIDPQATQNVTADYAATQHAAFINNPQAFGVAPQFVGPKGFRKYGPALLQKQGYVLPDNIAVANRISQVTPQFIQQKTKAKATAFAQ